MSRHQTAARSMDPVRSNRIDDIGFAARVANARASVWLICAIDWRGTGQRINQEMAHGIVRQHGRQPLSTVIIVM